MACPTYVQPSRSRRTVVLAGLEQTPGCVRSAGLQQILLYENPNPLQVEADIIRLNRIRNGLAPEGVAIGAMTSRFTGSMYMFGSGIPNVGPAWSIILQACGFKETRYVTDTAPAIATDEVTGVGATTGGSLAAGTYKYKFSLIPATATNGETKNTILDQTANGTTKAANGGIVASGSTGAITLDWSACTPLKAAGAKLRIYRTLAGGSAYYFIAQVDADDSPYTYVDTFSDDELADPIPTDHVSDEHVIWTPLNANHKSITMLNYLDSRKYPVSGTRGTIGFSGNFGEPFRGEMALQGIYNDSTEVANPAALATPGFPPRLVKTQLTISPSGGGSAYTPIVKSIAVDLGVPVTPRGDTNANEGIIEYGIFQELQPRIRLQIEVASAKDWIDEFKSGNKYKVNFYVSPLGVSGSPAGTIFQVIGGDDPAAGTAYGAQLVSAPQFDDSSGVRCFNLEFEPGQVDDGTNADDLAFLKFKQT